MSLWPESADAQRRAIVFLGFVARLAVLPFAGGLSHADEHFQSLEPAHAVAFDYGLLTWEWDTGIRSWLPAHAYGAFFRLVELLGNGASGELVSATQILCIGLSLLVVDSSYKIVRSFADARAAALAGLFAAVFPPLLFYAPRPLHDCTSAYFLCWAFARYARAITRASPPRAYLSVGALFAGAFALRFTVPIFFLGALAHLVWRREWRALFLLGLSFSAGVLVVGLFDWPTWGAPFHSLIEYFRFNVLSGGSEQWGVSPGGWYVTSLAAQLGVGVYIALVLAVAGLWGARGLGAGVLCGAVIMSLMKHKEERFLLPVLCALPFLLTLGASTWSRLLLRGRSLLAPLCLAALLVPAAIETARRDWRPLGDWHDATRFIGQRSDLRGVQLTEGWYASGGYVLLHRPVPLVASDHLLTDPAFRATLDNELFNYLAADEANVARLRKLGRDGAYTTVARFGAISVLRRR